MGGLDGCPLNGVWQLEICDLWAVDDGYVFAWGIDFADSLYPVAQSFNPTFGLECDSTFWTTTNQESHVVTSGQWNCADVGVTFDSPETVTYTAHSINNFGCEYSLDFDVTYEAFAADIQPSSENYCGRDVELVVVTGNDSDDFDVSWEASPYLSDTLGSAVTISGMSTPQTFQANVSQSFGSDLFCATTAEISIGTCEIKIPNIVTANSDGKNDKFYIQGLESFDDVEVTILNRWGTVVFESNDFGVSPAWDVDGEDVSSGVFYYVLTIPVDSGPLVVTDVNGELVQYEGDGPFVFKGFFHVMDDKD